MAGKLISIIKSILMKKLSGFIISVCFLISCHTSKTSSGKTVIEKNNIESLNGSWQLQMLFSSDNNWINTPFLNINLKDRSFSGNSSCNSISGKFTISESYIAFDKDIISTKMACIGSYEKSFLAALLKVNRYTLTKNELELGQGEIVLMKFKRS
jgi:heat shock protein HslJ